jgi:hypothetical protein
VKMQIISAHSERKGGLFLYYIWLDVLLESSRG